MITLTTTTAAETQALAERLAPLIRAGQVITLTGDLGAGKTTFTQGLARALGATGRVKSPTFNIMNTYQTIALPMYHFDAYRLEGLEVTDQGFEDYIQTDGVTLIEWPAFMAELLPNDYLALDFQRVSLTERRITLTPHGQQWTDLVAHLWD